MPLLAADPVIVLPEQRQVLEHLVNPIDAANKSFRARPHDAARSRWHASAARQSR